VLGLGRKPLSTQNTNRYKQVNKRINKQQSGTIPVLPAGGKETISSGPIFGLGRITVTVTALNESKTANGLVIGPLIFI